MELLKYVFISASSLVLAVILVIVYIWRKLAKPIPRPIIVKQYWGPGNPKDDEHTILPFKIDVSNEELKDLQQRLKNIRKLTPPLEDSFRYGFNTDYLQKVAKFWLEEYDWRSREKYLNSLPQFTTQVGGLQLHFLHVKPKQVPAGARVLPLLLLHGWPGSVREFYELIPLLTAARPGAGFVFEVVAPSLPGFGFSEGAAKPGLGPAQMGALFRVLMQRLGHFTFHVHGSDWGHIIGSSMATLFPESVLGFHTNMVYSGSLLSRFKMMLGIIYPRLVVESQHYSKVYPMGKHMAELLQESGYFHLHATKPDTIGVALQDSPIGLAAYVLEKFSTWTDNEWRDLPDGGLERKYTLTNLLDNIMIYWISGSITTSVRIYSEVLSKENPAAKLDRFPSVVPTAISNFPKELVYVPEILARDKFPNLVHFTHLPRGGHFPAFEEPQILADDMWNAFEQIQRYINENYKQFR